jgi:hypothetical protein
MMGRCAFVGHIGSLANLFASVAPRAGGRNGEAIAPIIRKHSSEQTPPEYYKFIFPVSFDAVFCIEETGQSAFTD